MKEVVDCRAPCWKKLVPGASWLGFPLCCCLCFSYSFCPSRVAYLSFGNSSQRDNRVVISALDEMMSFMMRLQCKHWWSEPKSLLWFNHSMVSPISRLLAQLAIRVWSCVPWNCFSVNLIIQMNWIRRESWDLNYVMKVSQSWNLLEPISKIKEGYWSVFEIKTLTFVANQLIYTPLYSLVEFG